MSLSFVGSVRSCTKRAAVIAVGLCAVFASGGAWADAVYVDVSWGSDSTGDGSSGKPYKTLPFAVSKAADGSTIILADGTYSTPSAETFLAISRPLTIRSANGPAKCALTTGVASGNGRGILKVDHDDAVIEGLTLRGGYFYNTSPGSPVMLNKGLMKNCVIRDNQGGVNESGVQGNRGGITVAGGTLKDSLVYGNTAIYNNNATGVGGGVYLSAGLVENCVISNNYSYKGGIYVVGGILRDSQVVSNHGHGSTTAKSANGGGVYIAGGTVERCLIRGNYGSTGAGAYLTGGKLLNSLVIANIGSNAGGGICNAGGTVAFCTVANNSVNGTTTGTGFNQTKGTTQNTVIYGNPCGAAGDATVSGGTFDHNFTMLAIAGYADNQHGNVHYRDAAKGDYRLLAGSKAIDGGVAYADVTTDYNGTARPQGTAHDMGCYEYVAGQGALTCTFNAPETTVFYRKGEATFTSAVDGADLAGVTYTWYFDDEEQSGKGTSITWENIGLGAHTVKLVVANAAGETDTCEQVGVIKVSTNHVYANANGSDEYPYETPEKGAHSLQDALDAVMDPDGGQLKVTVKPGRYCPNSKWFVINRPLVLESTDGPGATHLYADDPNGSSQDGRRVCRVLNVNHTDALVTGFTVSNGWWYSSAGDSGPGGMRLESGVVTNCVFTRNRGGDLGGAIQMSGGTLTDCRIFDNYTRYNNDACNTRGGGIYLTGGLVENCEIFRNWAAYPGDTGSGVWMSGGTVTNCVIHSNFSRAKKMLGIGVYISGGLLASCVITNNSKASKMIYPSVTAATVVDNGGGVYQKGGTVRNCLIADNRSNKSGSGVYQTGGTMEYCTIAGNTSADKVNSGVYLDGSKAVHRYNVISDNGAGTDKEPKCNISYVAALCFATNVVMPATDGVDNINSAAGFSDAAKGDWTLAAGSLAIDAGPAADDVTVDLVGETRPKAGKKSGTPANDLGCYEFVLGRGPLSCSFSLPDTTKFYLEGEASFEGTADGSDTTGLVYTWYFDGVEQAEKTQTIDWKKIGLGAHTVKLVVTNTRGEAATNEQSNVIKVSTDHVYANVNGTNKYPYDTPEKGAHNLQDALDAVMDPPSAKAVVTVKPGKYCPYSKWFIVQRALVLESTDGPAVTHLYGNNPDGESMEGRRVGRVLHVNHADALVSGFTVSNGWWYSAASDSGPGGMRLEAGVVTNCVFTRNRGGDLGGAVQMSGGTLTGCRIFDNYSAYNNTGCNTHGGGVYMTGGLVENCEIFRNWAAYPDDTGSGVWMNGGTLRRCCVHSNFSREQGMRGVGLYISGTALAECCVISNNARGSVSMTYPSATSSAVKEGGGVYQAGGTVRNCLIVGNKSNDNGAGVYQTGGTMEYCTITANTSANKKNSGLYLDGSGAVSRYNIISGNGEGVTVEANCNISYVSASSFTKNIVSPATSGTDNLDVVPGFGNAAKGDWTLAAGSPAIDAGAVESDVTTDLDGNMRPKDGNGDDIAANDLGCYEAPDASEGPLTCSFSPVSVSALERTNVTFTATAVGKGAKGALAYVWDFGGGTVVSGAGTATPTVRFDTYGKATVQLTVTPEEGKSAEKKIEDCVSIGSSSVYVAAESANPVWPYASWGTAAKDLETALTTLVLVDGQKTRVAVSNGTYGVTGKTLILSFAVDLAGVNGPSVTTIRGGNNHRCLDVTHADAFVSGFTLANAYWDAGGTSDTGAAALRLSAGVVSNCVVTGAGTDRSGCGAVAVKGTGLLTHSVIRNSYCSWGSNSGAAQYGGGLAVSGNGVARHLVVSNCYANAYTKGYCSGGGVAVYGGTLADSQILDCYCSVGEQNGSVVYQTGGTIERCVIGDTKNRNTHGAAIYQTGGMLRNSLVRGARAKTQAQALYLTGGTFANNTVVTNGYDAAHASPLAAVVDGGDVVNCLFARNNGGDVTRLSGTTFYSRFAEATSQGNNTAKDPLFRNIARGDWRQKLVSPCVNAGMKLDWMTDGATDLRGNPRVRGLVPDMGCYENQNNGLLLLVK